MGKFQRLRLIVSPDDTSTAHFSGNPVDTKVLGIKGEELTPALFLK